MKIQINLNFFATNGKFKALAFFFLLICSPDSLCAADSPIVQGLGGAGRSGVPSEGLFLNPATAVLLEGSSSFFHYTKPNIPEAGAGGRSLSIGALDADNPVAKGAAAYVRTSRARLFRGRQVYEDRKEFRLSMAQFLTETIAGGISGRYVMRGDGAATTKFFQGDLGILFSLFSDIRVGVTYENVSKKPGEEPPTLGVGAGYNLGAGIKLYGDGSRILRDDTKQGEKSWSLGAELNLFGDLVVRGGRFKKAFSSTRGWSLGTSWIGPRVTLDYALRTTTGAPHEKDHIFGLGMRF